jgi:hypothetical protein
MKRRGWTDRLDFRCIVSRDGFGHSPCMRSIDNRLYTNPVFSVLLIRLAHFIYSTGKTGLLYANNMENKKAATTLNAVTA